VEAQLELSEECRVEGDDRSVDPSHKIIKVFTSASLASEEARDDACQWRQKSVYSFKVRSWGIKFDVEGFKLGQCEQGCGQGFWLECKVVSSRVERR
jgi:hypothetical protein